MCLNWLKFTWCSPVHVILSSYGKMISGLHVRIYKIESFTKLEAIQSWDSAKINLFGCLDHVTQSVDKEPQKHEIKF